MAVGGRRRPHARRRRPRARRRPSPHLPRHPSPRDRSADLRSRIHAAVRAHGPQRLDFDLLRRHEHGGAVAAGLVCISAWCLLFLFYALGRDRSAGELGGFDLMWQSSTAGALRVLTVAGLGAAAVLAALARQAVGGRAPGLLLVLTLLAVSLNFDAIGAAEGLSPAVGTSSVDYSNRFWPDPARLLGVAVPALGVLAALALALAPRKRLGTAGLAVLAATPYVTYLAGLALTSGLWTAWDSNADYRADALYRVLPELQVMLIGYLLFGVAAWVDLVLRFGSRLGQQGALSRTWVLPVVVGVKALWLALGLLGWLPAGLGGGAAAWAQARDDGIAGWTTAAVVAALVVALYLYSGMRRRTPAGPTVLGVDRELGLFLMILVAPAMLAGVASLIFTVDWYAFPDTPPKLLRLLIFVAGATFVVHSLPPPGAPRDEALLAWARAAGAGVVLAVLVGLGFSNPLPFDSRIVFSPLSNLPTLVTAHFFLAVLACAGLAVVRFARRGVAARSACVVATFLLVVSVAHALPLAVGMPYGIDPQMAGATGDMIRPITATAVVPAPAQPWSTWWRTAAGTFTRPTFDAVLTLAALIMVAARRWWSDRTGRLARLLLVLLVVSTVIGQADVVRPTGWFGDRWFYLAFLVPVIYEFLIRAGDINASLRRSSAGALATVSGILLLLTIAGYAASTGSLEPGRSLESQAFAYGRGIGTDFLILVIACAALVSWAARTAPARPDREESR